MHGLTPLLAFLDIARDKDTFGTVDPNHPANLLVTTCIAATHTRQVSVYVL